MIFVSIKQSCLINEFQDHDRRRKGKLTDMLKTQL